MHLVQRELAVIDMTDYCQKKSPTPKRGELELDKCSETTGSGLERRQGMR